MYSPKRGILLVIGAFILVISFIGFVCVGYGMITGIRTDLAWNKLDRYEREKATQWYFENPPLEEATIVELCEIFRISDNDELCNGKIAVHAPDFFPIIINAYHTGITTYEQINLDLGKYEYQRTPPVKLSDGAIIYGIHYDLKGDRASELIFTFNEDNILVEFTTRVGEWAP